MGEAETRKLRATVVAIAFFWEMLFITAYLVLHETTSYMDMVVVLFGGAISMAAILMGKSGSSTPLQDHLGICAYSDGQPSDKTSSATVHLFRPAVVEIHTAVVLYVLYSHVFEDYSTPWWVYMFPTVAVSALSLGSVVHLAMRDKEDMWKQLDAWVVAGGILLIVSAVPYRNALACDKGLWGSALIFTKVALFFVVSIGAQLCESTYSNRIYEAGVSAERRRQIALIQSLYILLVPGPVVLLVMLHCVVLWSTVVSSIREGGVDVKGIEVDEEGGPEDPGYMDSVDHRTELLRSLQTPQTATGQINTSKFF